MELFTPALSEVSYCYAQSPLSSGSCFRDNEPHFNCELFAHVLLEELGFGLPKWLRSAELYRRSAGRGVWVDRIDSVEQLIRGDIVLLGPRPIQHIQDPLIYNLHVGVCIDTQTHLIAHASRYGKNGKKHPNGGGVFEQPLYDIILSKRYNTICAIRRPKH